MVWARQRELMQKVVTIAGTFAVLLASPHVGAQISYSSQELAMLPEYCKYTQEFQNRVEGGNDPVKIQQWYAVFGGTISQSGGTGIFHHMHHYCWGLTHINYAKFWVRTEQERRHHFGNSISEFNYMIRASKPGEKMLPEFHTKKGESLLALGNGPLAVLELERAIELKPDYWPPYAAMSDFYKGTGAINKARELLERGLSFSPDARALTRRLAELNTAKGKSAITPQPSRKTTAPKSPVQESSPQSDQLTETPLPPSAK